MIEKDKIRFLKADASYEKNNFYLLIQRQSIVNALFIDNIIRKF